MTVPALMVSTMNGTRLGGGFMMAPKGSPEDGVFDVCIAEQVSRPQMFALIQRFMAGTQENHPAIHIIQSTRVEATAMNGVLPAHGDGETISLDGKELTIELFPKQVELITRPGI
jgi:diacylglycerol kinase family enzyme